MNYVQLAWVIPALPLGAMLINFLVLRPLDLAARNRGQAHATTAGSGTAHHDDHSDHGSHDDAHAAADDDHGGGHGGHGDHGSGPLTPWAMASSILGTAAVAAAFIWSFLILLQFLGVLSAPSGLLKTGYE